MTPVKADANDREVREGRGDQLSAQCTQEEVMRGQAARELPETV